MRSWIVVGIWVAAAATAAACGGGDSNSSASTGGSAGNDNSGGQSNAGGNAAGGNNGGAAANGGSAASGGTGQGGATASGGASATGGGGQGGSGGSASSGFCPASPPAQHDACDTPGKWCSWGSDERFGCRIAAQCQDDNTWDRDPPAGDWGCPMPMPTCPSTGFSGNCTTAELGLTCVSANNTAYTCTNCNGTLCFQGQKWQQTSGKKLADGCPTDKLPNLGDDCSMEGLVCDYNMCADDQAMNQTWAHGVGMTCTNGHWTMWDSMMVCV